MNLLLQGERFTQQKLGNGVTSEYVKRKHTFVCIAETDNIRVLGDFEDIHLKSTQGNMVGVCCACGFYDGIDKPYAHYEEEDADKWAEHPRRCNFAYIP